jgi:hypothetical protein
MFQFRKDPIQIEPDLELQIEVVQNNPNLSDKEKKKQIKKLRWKQTKQALQGKGGIE